MAHSGCQKEKWSSFIRPRTFRLLPPRAIMNRPIAAASAPLVDRAGGAPLSAARASALSARRKRAKKGTGTAAVAVGAAVRVGWRGASPLFSTGYYAPPRTLAHRSSPPLPNPMGASTTPLESLAGGVTDRPLAPLAHSHDPHCRPAHPVHRRLRGRTLDLTRPGPRWPGRVPAANPHCHALRRLHQSRLPGAIHDPEADELQGLAGEMRPLRPTRGVPRSALLRVPAMVREAAEPGRYAAGRAHERHDRRLPSLCCPSRARDDAGRPRAQAGHRRRGRPLVKRPAPTTCGRGPRRSCWGARSSAARYVFLAGAASAAVGCVVGSGLGGS